MTKPELEAIEERNDIRRERYPRDQSAIADIDALIAEIQRLNERIQLADEAIDLTMELSSTPKE